MSTAAAKADALVAGDAAPKKGKKKLIIILAAVLLLVLVGGGAAMVVMKQKAAAAAEEEGDDGAEATAVAEKRKDHAKNPPVFVPLEAFVVNLADKETDRFAQIGITLEVEDAKFAEEMKAYMPAIRNGILMVLSHKTSAQLLSRESVLPLGIEVSTDKEAEPEPDAGDDEDAPKPKKRKKAGVSNPVKHVHFSNFIVQ
jgi:flagellar FliL protein